MNLPAALSDAGDSAVLLPFALLLIAALWRYQSRAAATTLIVAMVVCGAVMIVLKTTLIACGQVWNAGVVSPSGHASMSATVYGALGIIAARQAPRWQQPANRARQLAVRRCDRDIAGRAGCAFLRRDRARPADRCGGALPVRGAVFQVAQGATESRAAGRAVGGDRAGLARRPSAGGKAHSPLRALRSAPRPASVSGDERRAPAAFAAGTGNRIRISLRERQPASRLRSINSSARPSLQCVRRLSSRLSRLFS